MGTSTPIISRSLDQYVADCQRLADDVRVLIDDIEFRLSGGSLRYAIDFAEIRAYIDPEVSVEEVKIFYDDSADYSRSIQYAIMSSLFNNVDSKPILLGPYIGELQDSMRYLRSKGARYVVQNVSLAIEEVRTVANAAREVEEIVIKLRDTPEIVSETERKQVVDFLEMHASHLVLLVQGDQVFPAMRLAELLRNRPFDEISTLNVDLDSLPLNEDTLHGWTRRLAHSPTRSSEANYRDAFVMMLLEALETVPEDNKTRLCLVTRSSRMHRGVAEDIAAGVWRGRRGSPLRHPRSFITVQMRDEADLRRTKEDLERLHESISIFVELALVARIDTNEPASAAWAPLTKLVQEHRHESVRRLREIKREWRRLVALVTADSWRDDQTIRASASRRSDESLDNLIHDIFRVVHDPKALAGYIHERIRELTHSIGDQYQFTSALALMNDVEGPTSIFAEAAHARPGTDSITIDATNTFIPYTIKFFSPQMEVWSERVHAQKRIERDEIFNLVKSGFEHQHPYEPLLALAYFFGASDDWRSAEAFAALAVAAHVDDDPSAGEGYLFRAICLRRMGDKSIQCYEEAMQLIDDARALIGESDTRLLAEQATQLIYWSDVNPGAHITAADIINLTDRAIAALGNASDDISLQLKARIYNNRCYYLLRHLDDENASSQASHDLQQLLTIQHLYESDSSRWLPHIVDTTLWAEWLLRVRHLCDDMYDRERAALISQYEQLMGRDMPAMSRGTIRTHCKKIRDTTQSKCATMN